MRLLDGLETGRLDLLLLALPCDCGEAETLPIAEDPFLLACPPGHPPGGAGRACRLRALAGERLLLLEEGHCLRDQALAACGLPAAPLSRRNSPRPRCIRWCRWWPAGLA